MSEIVETLELLSCSDCVQMITNGEINDGTNRGDRIADAILKEWGPRNKPWDLVVVDGDPTFSRASCDTCNDPLAGDRYAVDALRHAGAWVVTLPDKAPVAYESWQDGWDALVQGMLDHAEAGDLEADKQASPEDELSDPPAMVATAHSVLAEFTTDPQSPIGRDHTITLEDHDYQRVTFSLQWTPTVKVVTYKIVRFFADDTWPSQTITTGLTLDEARQHCDDPETSSKTATSAKALALTLQCGRWFDGYRAEE